ncbi:MAG: hypothetical protein SNJ70_08350 [Armatimonadota bacterium]
MPANLTPEYKNAEARYRSAKTAEEKYAALKDMMASVPKHKGTEKIRADIKRKLSQLKNEIDTKKVNIDKNTTIVCFENEELQQFFDVENTKSKDGFVYVVIDFLFQLDNIEKARCLILAIDLNNYDFLRIIEDFILKSTAHGITLSNKISSSDGKLKFLILAFVDDSIDCKDNFEILNDAYQNEYYIFSYNKKDNYEDLIKTILISS